MAKRIYTTLLMAAAVLMAYSCGEDPIDPKPVDPPEIDPTIYVGIGRAGLSPEARKRAL